MAAPLALRRALLILDLQNEFLAPSGRCRVSNFPAVARKGPSFVDNILSFVTAFRQAGRGDIIWVRSEFSKPRDANDEKVLLYEEEDSEDGEGAGGEGREGGGQEGDRIGRFDEFLSSAIDPYCEKGSPAADFHESVIAATKAPGDRIIRKTWYSAFIKTGLVEILRGRLATELFICGLKTNISVFATVSDAVRHGFQVTVLGDCVGFSDQRLHDVAMSQMAGVLGCEVTRSAGLVGEWTAKKTKPARSMSSAQATATTKEDLTKMIEQLSLSNDMGVKVGKGQPKEEAEEAPEQQQPQQRKQPQQRQQQQQQQPQLQQQPMQQPGGLDADIAPHHVQKKPSTRRQAVVESKPLRKIKGIPALLREGDKMGEGDTKLVNGILPPDLENVAFDRLRHEVRWRTMLHRGGEVPRLVAVEGEIGKDGRQVGLSPFFLFFFLSSFHSCSHDITLCKQRA